MWCYLGQYVAAICQLTAHDYFGLEGQVPEALYHGGFADISKYIQFDWYQYVWYMNPKSEKQLGWWVGVAKDVGGLMTFWILLKSGIIIPRSSVTALAPEEIGSNGMKAMMKELDDGIRQRIRDQLKDNELLPGFEDFPGIIDGPWDIKDEVFNLYEPEASAPEADEYEDLELFDKYIGAAINLN